MQVPAVAFIEMAADHLTQVPKGIVEDQRRELREFGNGRAREIGATGLTEDFVRGYELGLETARMLLLCAPVVTKDTV